MIIKIILSLLLLTGIFFAFLIYIQHYYMSRAAAGYVAVNASLSGSYFYKDAKVYYSTGGNFFSVGASVLDQADLASFVVLNEAYAKDNAHVYIRDEVIENADPSSFQLMDSLYSKDAQHAYYYLDIIDSADPATFVKLWGDYYADKTRVFYYGKKLFELGNESVVKIDGDVSAEFIAHGTRLYRNGVMVKRSELNNR